MTTSRRFRWSCLLDSIIIVGILATINFVWFRHNPAFRSWAVHPYILPLALVGLFYGFRESLAALLIVNLGYSAQIAAAGLPWTALLEKPDFPHLVAFLLAALLFGEAGELYQRALGHHRDRGAALDASLARALAENRRLTDANKELQEWIRFGDVQLTEIHAASDHLFSFDESRILEAVAPLALKIVGAEQCALYWYDRSKGRFWRRYQAGHGENNPSAASHDTSPFLQVRTSGRPLSVKDIDSYSTGLRFLAAAPISVQGAVQGVLLIESMPLLRLTPYTMANLGFLTRLVNRCLENAALIRRGETAADQTHFRERLNQEIHASKRYKADLSLLYIDVNDFESLHIKHGPEAAGSLIDQVTRIVSRSKRGSDVLSYQGNGRFALLMPQTSPAKTGAFVERTKEEMGAIEIPGDGARRPEFSFQLGTSTLEQLGFEEPSAR